MFVPLYDTNSKQYIQFSTFWQQGKQYSAENKIKTQQKPALITVDGKFSGCFLLPKHINRSHKSFIMNWTIQEKRKTMAKTIEWNWCVPRENFTISIHAINGWRVCVRESERGWISMRYRTSIAAVSRHSFSQRECTSKIYIIKWTKSTAKAGERSEKKYQPTPNQN